MTCHACLEPSEIRGAYVADCTDCGARLLARGPWFAESQAVRRLVPAYVAGLRRVFGAQCDLAEAHARVKAAAGAAA